MIQCTALQRGTVYPSLQQLEEGGVVTSELEHRLDGSNGRPWRRIYMPASTELGQEFAALLEPPESCNLMRPDTDPDLRPNPQTEFDAPTPAEH